VREIGPITALLSGDATDADELLTLCESAIRTFAGSTPVDDSDIAITKFLENIREAAAARKRTLVDHYLDMNIAMSFEEFVKRHRSEFTEPHSRDIWAQIQQIDLGAEILLCGFSDDEGVIVRLDRYGRPHWESNYSVVGVGSDIAFAFLCQRNWETKDQKILELPDCVYRIYEAKRASENNRHVGKSTVIEILMPGGKRVDITEDCYKHFKQTYEKRLHLEPFKFDTAILREKDDEKKSAEAQNSISLGRVRTYDTATPSLAAESVEAQERAKGL
jgi:hypothetical protein